jgi:hypothetical protein
MATLFASKIKRTIINPTSMPAFFTASAHTMNHRAKLYKKTMVTSTPIFATIKLASEVKSSP